LTRNSPFTLAAARAPMSTPTMVRNGRTAFFDIGATVRLVPASAFTAELTRSRVWQATQNPYASGPPALARRPWTAAARIPTSAPTKTGVFARALAEVLSSGSLFMQFPYLHPIINFF